MLKKFYLVTALIAYVCLSYGYGQTNSGTGYGVLIDNTGSLRSQLDKEKELAKVFVSIAKQDSPISFFTFLTVPGSDSKLAAIASGALCSKDRELIKRQIDSLTVAIGLTTLMDAIQGVSDAITEKRTNCDEQKERILVLVTDGEDRASSVRKDDLINSLKRSGTKVFTIGLVDELPEEAGPSGKSVKQTAKEFLEKLAKGTDGKVIFPKRKQKAEDIIKELFS